MALLMPETTVRIKVSECLEVGFSGGNLIDVSALKMQEVEACTIDIGPDGTVYFWTGADASCGATEIAEVLETALEGLKEQARIEAMGVREVNDGLRETDQ